MFVDKRTLYVILLTVFIALLGVGIVAPNMPIYATVLGATGTMIGFIVASFSIVRGIAQPIVGSFADRSEKKRLLVAGLLIYCTAGLFYSFASSIAHLIFIRMFHGFGSAMVVPIAMAYVSDLSPAGEEGKYMGTLNVAIFCGIGSGPLIGGLFRDLWGMDAVFWAMSFLSATALVLVLLFLPKRPTQQPSRSAEKQFNSFMAMLRNRKILGVLISHLTILTVMIPTLGFLPLLMTQVLDAKGVHIGLVLLTRTVVNATLQTSFGKLADRSNKQRILLSGGLIICITLALVPMAHSLIVFIILFAVLGVGEAMSWPVIGSYAVEEGRRHGHGSIMGIYNMAGSAGIMVGSLLAGAFMDVAGLAFSFYSISIFVVIGFLVAHFLIVAATPEPQWWTKMAEVPIECQEVCDMLKEKQLKSESGSFNSYGDKT